MKREPLKKSLAAVTFEKAARQIGARVIFNGDYGWAGQIRFKNGKTQFFRRAHLDINPHGAFEIAKYKCYTNYFLEKFGFPVVKGMTFFSDKFARELGSKRDTQAAYRFARSLGFPVIVKPNSKGQGQGVAKVYNKREFHDCVAVIFKDDSAALVQQFVRGRDYRVTVLDDKVISAFERRGLEVTGDGKSSIRELLEAKQRWSREYRGLGFGISDYRMALNLRRRKAGFDTVLRAGEQLQLLDNANVSTGGEAYDVLPIIHRRFQKIAVDVTRQMGLRLAGVDFMVEGDIGDPPGKYWILELNAAPGLDNYADTRERRAEVLEGLFVQVLKACERGG